MQKYGDAFSKSSSIFYIQVFVVAPIVCDWGEGCSVVLGAIFSLAIVLLRMIELVALL